MAKLGSSSSEQDSTDQDEADADEDALHDPNPEYTDLINADWLERQAEPDSLEDEPSFDFEVELSSARDSELDEEVVNLFDVDVDVGSLLTSSPLGAVDFEAGPFDPSIADGLIDIRSSLDGELSDQSSDELDAGGGLQSLSLPRSESPGALEPGDDEVGGEELFPAFEDAPGAAPLDWADDAGQEGIAEEGE